MVRKIGSVIGGVQSNQTIHIVFVLCDQIFIIQGFGDFFLHLRLKTIIVNNSKGARKIALLTHYIMIL